MLGKIRPMAVGMILSLAMSALGDVTDGEIVGVDRKTKGYGYSCNGIDIDHLLWVMIKKSDDSKQWFVVGANSDLGKQLLSIGLTAMSTGANVRISHESSNFCTNSYEGRSAKYIDGLWVSNDGF